jgi:hypothetical protein
VAGAVNRHAGWRPGWILLVLLAARGSAAAQDLAVRCERGCGDPGLNRSLNLLLRQDAAQPITMAWETSRDPAADGRQVILYAGNPEGQDRIPARGRLEFREQGGTWRATRDFEPAELGRGTFLTVVTARPKNAGEDPDGSNERILDWRAFRLLTVAEARARVHGPDPPNGFSISVTPALLQARTGHGNLPRSQNADATVWWSLLGSEGNTTDLDLDGDNNGIPGLGVQVSTPWETRGGQDWKSGVLDHLAGVDGHTIRFDGFEWHEAPDRTVTLDGIGDVKLKPYYTAITLHTTASVRSFSKDEVGGASALSFSHETSAPLKNPDDPRFWASYSRRDYGADPRLLAMLQRQIQSQGSVPGLVGVQGIGGDGGTPTYTVGFYVAVRPWEEPPAGRRFRAGIVGVDVVAARAGVGGLSSRGSGGAGTIGDVWCRVVRCGENNRPLDLDRPPDGYRGASATASLQTIPGNLPLIDGDPEIAEKGLVRSVLPNLPTRARFGVSAGLRAGALMREGWFGSVKDVVPIDTYAQFVAKITVAMFPDVPVIADTDVTIPSRADLAKEITVPEPRPSWWRRHPLAALIGGLVGLAALVAIVPGGLTLLRSVFGLVVKLLQWMVDAAAATVDRLRRRDRSAEP